MQDLAAAQGCVPSTGRVKVTTSRTGARRILIGIRVGCQEAVFGWQSGNPSPMEFALNGSGRIGSFDVVGLSLSMRTQRPLFYIRAKKAIRGSHYNPGSIPIEN